MPAFAARIAEAEAEAEAEVEADADDAAGSIGGFPIAWNNAAVSVKRALV